MGGLCGRINGLVGLVDDVTGFGGRGGFFSSTGDSVNLFVITYPSASWYLGGIGGGLGFVGGDVGGIFNDGDRDGKFDLGGGGGGVSGSINFSNTGVVLSVRLSSFGRLPPSGLSSLGPTQTYTSVRWITLLSLFIRLTPTKDNCEGRVVGWFNFFCTRYFFFFPLLLMQHTITIVTTTVKGNEIVTNERTETLLTYW